MAVVERIRKLVEEQQYDDNAFWKNRDLLRQKAKVANGVEMHGSAVTIHGKGIIVSGKSESGKTTTWFHLLKRGGRAISEDLTNLVFRSKRSPLLVAPATQHAFRIHGKFHRLDTLELPYGIAGKMKSGSIIPRYRAAPMDDTAVLAGRPLRAIFYIEKQRLHPNASPRIVAMDDDKLAWRLQTEDTSTFPSLFALPETHTRESIRRLKWDRKKAIATQLVRELRQSGVHFFQVYAPKTRDPAKQALSAQAISQFVRGFTGKFKPGLNLMAINRQHSGEVFHISHSTVIGTSADLKIGGDDRIEARHTVIKRKDRKWVARDLGTKAHTHILKKERVDKGKVDWRRLKGTMEIGNGDLIAVGRTFFQIVIK